MLVYRANRTAPCPSQSELRLDDEAFDDELARGSEKPSLSPAGRQRRRAIRNSIGAAIVGGLAGGISASLLYRAITPPLQDPASYLIDSDPSSGKIRGLNGSTGKVDSSDSDAATVIQDCIDRLSTGGIIQLNLGSYESPVTISKPITMSGRILLRGRGPYSTFLKLADNVNDSMLKFIHTGSFYYFTMMDMGISGNGKNQSAGSIVDVNSDYYDGLIFNCHLMDAKEYNIKLLQPWNWRISHSSIEGAGNAGLYVNSNDDLKVVETKFLYNATGADIRCNRARFTGCYFWKNTQNGLYVTDSDSCTLVGSQFRLNSLGNVNSYDEIYLGTVTRFKAIGVAIDGDSTSRYGFNFSSQAEHNDILGCTVVNMASAGILNNGKDTRVDGMVLPSGVIASAESGKVIMGNSGNAVIAAGSRSTDVSHNLPAAPARVFLTPTTDFGGKRYWVSAKSAKSFTIMIDSASTSDIAFDWRAALGEG